MKTSSEEYAALIIAAQRLGYGPEDFECAMTIFWAKDGQDVSPEHWKRMRAEIEREAAKVLAERPAGDDS